MGMLFSSQALLSGVASVVTITSGAVGTISFLRHLRDRQAEAIIQTTRNVTSYAPAEAEETQG
jgi:hypothetical protein